MRIALASALLVSLLAACSPGPTPSIPIPSPSASASAPAPLAPLGSPSPASAQSPASGSGSAATAPPLSGSGSISTGNATLTARLTPEKLYLGSQGESQRFSLSLTDANGKPVDPGSLGLVWTSSQPDQVSVDANGMVTALTDFGHAIISVRDPRSGLSLSGSVDVTSLALGSASARSGRDSGSGTSSPAPLERLSATVGFEGLGLGAMIVHEAFSFQFHKTAVARSASGQSIVVWRDQDGDGYGIFAQRYTAGREPIGGEIRINESIAGEQSAPTVAMDADGSFVVAWQSYGHAGGSGSDVYTRRYDAMGGFEPEIIINEITGDQSSPAVGMDADGDFVVAWSSTGHAGGDGEDIIARRYNAGTASYEAASIVNSDLTGAQSLPALAMNADGDFVVAWSSSGHAGGENLDIFVRRYEPGIGFEASANLVNDITGDQNNPAVALNDAGDVIVAWDSTGHTGGAGGYDIFASRALAGAGFETAAIVNATTGTQTQPAVAMDADGDFIIAWQSEGHAGGDYSDIVTRRYESGSFGPEAVFDGTLGYQNYPALAMQADGAFLIAWQGHRYTNMGVFVRFYDAQGNSL